jgi:hypothetical protein
MADVLSEFVIVEIFHLPVYRVSLQRQGGWSWPRQATYSCGNLIALMILISSENLAVAGRANHWLVWMLTGAAIFGHSAGVTFMEVLTQDDGCDQFGQAVEHWIGELCCDLKAGHDAFSSTILGPSAAPLTQVIKVSMST